jgi:hypothetical protein
MSLHARALSLLLVASVAAGGGACATVGEDRIRVPGEQAKVYVSVFVDETDRGEVGVPLTQAIQMTIWERDRSALALSFEKDALAIDGTVVALEDVALEGGNRQVRLRMKAHLVDKDGKRVLVLRTAESRAVYAIDGDPEVTEQRRKNALNKAIFDMARHIVTSIDQAAREAPVASATRHRGSRAAERA